MSVTKRKRKEKREKKRERQKEIKRKIVNLVYLPEHRISIFYRGEHDSYSLVRSFETSLLSAITGKVIV